MNIHLVDVLENVSIYTCATGCVIDNLQIKDKSIDITPACFLLHSFLYNISFHIPLCPITNFLLSYLYQAHVTSSEAVLI